MSDLSPLPILGGFERSWDGFDITEITNYELVALSAVNGEQTRFVNHISAYFGEKCPLSGTNTPVKGGSMMWLGPDQYLVMLDENNIDADKNIASAFEGTAYAVLQSDGWAALKLSGANVYNVLERFIPLDLRGAPDNFAARTSAHHISVIVAKQPDGTLVLLTPRSSARSFLDALTLCSDNVFS